MSSLNPPHSTPIATTHRLATVSASAALQKAAATGSSISCGSARLDGLLALGADARGGLPRGKVVDLHGPPGVGKTTLGLTAAANTIRAGGSVVWIDCSAPISAHRLNQIVSSSRSATVNVASNTNPPPLSSPTKTSSTAVTLENFHHYNAPTLAHLLALLLRPPLVNPTSATQATGSTSVPAATFPPPDTQLLVLDSLSTLLTLAFPYSSDLPSSSFSSSSSNTSTAAKKQAASARRWAIQRDIAAALSRLAAVRHVAVLVTQQLATRIDRDMGGSKQRAVLRATLSTKSWTEGGIWARVLLCRHWGSRVFTEEAAAGREQHVGRGSRSASKHGDVGSITRFAVLVKLGSTEFEGFARMVPYCVDESGILDAKLTNFPHPRYQNGNQHQNARPRNQGSTTAVIEDSIKRPYQHRLDKSSSHTGISVVPAKRHAAEIADSESDGEDEENEAAAAAAAGTRLGSDGAELEEVDEFGMTKEEQAMLELEMMEAQTDEGVP